MRTLFLACFLLTPISSAAGQDAFTPSEIQGAREKGRLWLKSRLDEELHPAQDSRPLDFERRALGIWALLRAGETPRALSPHLEWLIENATWLSSSPQEWSEIQFETYATSLYVLCWAATAEARQETAEGEVAYRRGKPKAGARRELQRATRYLAQLRWQGKGVWPYSPMRPPDNYPSQTPRWDNSNTQFAVYALHAADCLGVTVKRKVWEEVWNHFLKDQEKGEEQAGAELSATCFPVSPLSPGEPGGTRPRRVWSSGSSLEARGWNYGGYARQRDRRPASISMTAAGLSSLAMAYERLSHRSAGSKLRARQAHAALRDGLVWLSVHWGEIEELELDYVGQGHAPFYDLWSLEKALDGVGVVGLNGQDGWEVLAQITLRLQHEDGSWGDARPRASTTKGEPKGSPVDTALALQVLNRGTLFVFDQTGERPRAEDRPLTGGE